MEQPHMQLVEIWLNCDENQTRYQYDRSLIALQQFCYEHQLIPLNISENEGTAQLHISSSALEQLKRTNFVARLPVAGNHPAIFASGNKPNESANDEDFPDIQSPGLTA